MVGRKWEKEKDGGGKKRTFFSLLRPLFGNYHSWVSLIPVASSSSRFLLIFSHRSGLGMLEKIRGLEFSLQK